MARKITFNELHKMVSKIDYINKKSYPVVFSVKNGKDTEKYECGITGSFDYQGEEYDEQQYLALVESYGHEMDLILDLVDPDFPSFDEIGNMLKQNCHIDENSEITFYDGKSFKGKEKYIEGSDANPLFIAIQTQCNLTKEVKKGLDWLKEIIGISKEEPLLISTRKNTEEHINLCVDNLNEMGGSMFAFLFNRKVLYYDICFHVLCTYAPCSGRDLKDYYVRIECNDNFKWVLLKVCTGEDLLSGTKSCDIKVTEPNGTIRYINEINHDKMVKTFQKNYEKVLEMSK